MHLGKRGRTSMRRTTSITEFSSEDLAAAAAAEGTTKIRRQGNQRKPADRGLPPRSMQRRKCEELTGAVADSAIAQFLTVCALCKRRLGPGLDTFIYRGEMAFCSQECRQQQMSQDELHNKCSRSAVKKEGTQPSATSEASSNGETVAVA